MFVIYKENSIPTIGGVHPTDLEVGLATYDGWNLAICPDEKIQDYSEYDFVSVPNKVARGLQLLDSEVESDQEDETMDEIKADLSDQDKKDIEDAKTFINNINLKTVTRAKVREIKDIEDDLVDMKRMVHSMVSFIVDDWNVKSDTEKDKSRYKDVMSEIGKFLNSNSVNMTSFKDDSDKISKLVDDEVKIADLVESYYLTKKL